MKRKSIPRKLLTLLLALSLLAVPALPARADAEVVSVAITYAGLKHTENGEEVILISPEKKIQLTALVEVTGDANKSVTWECVNPDGKTVASVANGVVTAGVDAGIATIKATSTADTSKSATIKVRRTEIPVEGVRAASGDITVYAGGTAEIEAVVWPINADYVDQVTWQPESNLITITPDSGNPRKATIQASSAVTNNQDVRVTITTLNGNCTATVTVTVRPKINVTGVSLSDTSIFLAKGDSRTLTATVSPPNATDQSLQWTSSNTNVATVDKDGKVTAVAAGTATITVTTINMGYTATCEVTVTDEQVYANTIEIVETPSDPTRSLVVPKDGTLDLSARLLVMDSSTGYIDTGKQVTAREVTWSVANATYTDSAGVKKEEAKGVYYTGRDDVVYEQVASINPTTGRLTGLSPGKAVVTATAQGETETITATVTVEVSGIVIEPARRTLAVGGKTSILPHYYGDARTSRNTWAWTIDNGAVARVNAGTGEVSSLAEGRAYVTCTDGVYSNTCLIIVETNDGVDPIAVNVTNGHFTLPGSSVQHTFNGKLEFKDINQRLYEVCEKMTGVEISGDPELEYITNLTVSTEQGTLYDRYAGEPDTGAGISAEKSYYYDSKRAGVSHIEDVYFVPKPDYTGDVTIRYTGYTAKNNVGLRNAYTGSIVITGLTSGAGIQYTVNDGEPVRFQSMDFNNYSLAQNGRSIRYVTFTLPSERYGTLQYSSIGNGLYERAVTAETRYYYGSSPDIDDIWLVPRSGNTSNFTISFSGYDTSGDPLSGTVSILVKGAEDTAEQTDLSYSVPVGERVYLNVTDFSNACTAAGLGQLNYIYFNSTPSSSRGTLYYNGGTRVSANSNNPFYRSATGSRRSISDLSFLAASGSNAPGTTSFGFTGYDVNGQSFTGTVRITVTSSSGTALSYTTEAGQRLWMNSADFSNASYSATGNELSYIRFSSLPAASQGTFYRLNGDAVTSSDHFYRAYSGSSGGRLLIEDLNFVPANGFTGTFTIPYTGRSASGNGRDFTGSLTITVNPSGTQTTPVAGPNASLIYYSGGEAVQFRPADFIANAADKLKYALSTVRFVRPDADSGRLCINYVSPTQYTLASGGQEYAVSSLNNLWFQPTAGFSGTAYIAFFATDVTGKNYSGTAMVQVAPPSWSSYYNDMGSHAWAVPAVDFLSRYGILNGVGNRSYNPSAPMIRGDFVLMLSRAFSLPSVGTSSFADVSPDKYYAAAIASAKATGVAAGDNSNAFYPDAPVSRQDAAVFLYNAMRRSGSMPSGSREDLEVFNDYMWISDYALEAMATLVRLGVFIGDGSGYLNPRGTLTRAEMATLFYRAIT